MAIQDLPSGFAQSKRNALLSVLTLHLLPAILFLPTPGCGPTESVASDQFSFQVRLDESMLQFCKRMENSQGPSCDELDLAAASMPEHPLLFPAVSAGQLPPQKRSIRNLIRFEGLLTPGDHQIPLKQDRAQQAKELLGYVLQSAQDRFNRLEQKAEAPDASNNTSDPTTRQRHSPGSKKTLTQRERIILASIVEKEAVSNRNYDRVAAVFLNRLDGKQALGSCPTVEYGLGYHRPFLLFKDLELQSDYNVYKRAGLPPTPIAQFSDEAYLAVLNPANTEDIFFVYDWTTGNLHFAVEYRDHKTNAARARANFISKYGKSPMYQRFDNLYYEDLPEDEYRKGD